MGSASEEHDGYRSSEQLLARFPKGRHAAEASKKLEALSTKREKSERRRLHGGWWSQHRVRDQTFDCEELWAISARLSWRSVCRKGTRARGILETGSRCVAERASFAGRYCRAAISLKRFPMGRTLLQPKHNTRVFCIRRKRVDRVMSLPIYQSRLQRAHGCTAITDCNSRILHWIDGLLPLG